MRLLTVTCAFALCFATAALSDDAVKPFTGTWSAPSQSGRETPNTWVFEQKGDVLRIAEMNGQQKIAEFECNTMGRECEIKDEGKKATVSMWFNGPKLVELESRGSDVIKRRFALTQKGDAMDVEIIPISHEGKPETLRFTRVEVTAHN